MIKNSFLKICALGAVLIFASSCEKKKDDVVTPDPGKDPIEVSNGYYLSKSDGVPTEATVLKTEVVEAANFGTQSRAGFLTNYLYLTAGNYNIVQVADQAAFKTFGAALVTSFLGTGDSDSGLDYAQIGKYTEGGAPFVVTASGLYKVIVDQTTTELLLYKIQWGNIIGAASPAGWGHADNQKILLVGNESATEIKYELSGIALNAGEYKIRFNSRWKIDRRSVKEGPTAYDPASGYVALTNYGGSLAAPVAGGANFSIAADAKGLYKVTLTWTPSGQFAISVVKTGEIPIPTYKAADYKWEVMGTAGNTWSEGIALTFDATSKTWKGTVALKVGEFKFRADAGWKTELGFAGNKTGDFADFTDKGGNFEVKTAGTYDITISTTTLEGAQIPNGVTWSVDFKKKVTVARVGN